jgi:hypothetical protein
MSFWCFSQRGKPKNCNSVPIKAPKAAAAAAAAAVPKAAAAAQIPFIPDPKNPYCRLDPAHFKAENMLLVFYVQTAKKEIGTIFVKTIEKRGKEFIYSDATDEYIGQYVNPHEFGGTNFLDTIQGECRKEALIDTVNNIKRYSCQGSVSDGYIADQMRENQIYILLFLFNIVQIVQTKSAI